MMTMQLKIFSGELPAIEDKFNEWSDGTQYIQSTSLHFHGKDRSFAVLQVVYGTNEPPKSRKGVVNRNITSRRRV